MSYSVQLPVYSGPLDLLLQLVEREELEITAVALAQVTDQFLAAVRALEAAQLADIADFLVVAAKLIYIKSEFLLPRPAATRPSDEELGADLSRQLMEYKKYKEIAGLLHERQLEGRRTFVRVAAPPRVEAKLDLSYLTPQHLRDALSRVLAVRPDGPTVSSVVAPPKITVGDRMRLIAARLRDTGRAWFRETLRLAQATSRMEIVITFLALLELIKQGRVMAIQERTFGDIEIRLVGGWPESEQFETEFAE